MAVPNKKLLVLDTSYTLEDILKRGILASVTCRDINGYFTHVWTVHPVATLVTTPEWTPKFGIPVCHTISAFHTFIEGKMGRFKWLKWLSPINFFIGQIGLFFLLKKLIKKENINLIRAGDPLYLGLFGLLLAKICKIPLVVRVGGNHDKVYETTGQPLQKRVFFTRSIEKKVERFVFKRADLVAGANEDNLNFALANGAKKSKSTIFRYGNLLDASHFVDPVHRQEGASLLHELNITPQKFLLYIGRLEKVKHPDHVIEVLSHVRQKGYNVKALFVGDGTMHNELELLAAQKNLKEHVIFAGNQNQAWLSRIIPLSAVVISPHTGRALSEAALGNVCVAAYDIDWQGEIIINEVTGLLVTHPKIEKLCEAAERFLADETFAKKMKHSLRERAINMLEPAKLNQHEINEYDKLLA
jgi:glycosyltransferase involved in cell wall biosynthesis